MNKRAQVAPTHHFRARPQESGGRPNLSHDPVEDPIPNGRVTPPHPTYDNHHHDDEEETKRTIDAFLEQAYHPHTRCHHRWRYYLLILSIASANVANELQFSSIKYMLADRDFQSSILRDDDETLGPLLAGIILLGMIAGGIAAAGLERYFHLGRKTTLCVGLGLNVLGGISVALSPHYAVVAAGRLLSGIGIGCNITSSTTLATELCPPRERGFYVALIDSHWTVGGIALAALAWAVLGASELPWRLFLALSCAVPPALSLGLVVRFVPESPRYLALQERYREVADVANAMALTMGYQFSADNGAEEDEVVNKGTENEATATNSLGRYAYGTKLTEEEVLHQFEHAARQDSLSGTNTGMSFFSSVTMLYAKGQRKNTIALQMLWICISFTDALSLWIVALFEEVHVQNIYMSSLLLAFANIPGNLASITLVDRVGRKTLFTWFMGLMAVTLAYFSRVANTTTGGGGERESVQIVLCACFFISMLSGGWSVNTVQTGELFPTDLRYTGFMLCATGGRLANFSSQFVNGALMDRPRAQLVVACCIAAVGSVISCCFPMDEMARVAVRDEAETNGSGEERVQSDALCGTLDGSGNRRHSSRNAELELQEII